MTSASSSRVAPPPSLYRLLDPAVLANPYPLYREIREAGSVLWDPYLHTWVVSGYADVVRVFQTFSADRTPTPEQLDAMGLSVLGPVAQIMVRQMLFMDGASHARLRSVCSAAFTSRSVRSVEQRILTICNDLLEPLRDGEPWDLLADFAEPLPAIITAELLGLPGQDWRRLKSWSESFARLLGNLQHSPDQAQAILTAANELDAYVRRAVAEQRRHPKPGLIGALLRDGHERDRLDNNHIVANVIVTLVGGLETTTNLIAGGVLTLLDHPESIDAIRCDPTVMATAVEELLRFESPSQHTGRIAPYDLELGGHHIAKGDAVMAVMAAANRDPAMFPEPDRLDIRRAPNRHVAFAWGPHFCFGAPLARMEARIGLDTLFGRVRRLDRTAQPLVWRENLGLRGLTSLVLIPSLAKSSC